VPVFVLPTLLADALGGPAGIVPPDVVVPPPLPVPDDADGASCAGALWFVFSADDDGEVVAGASISFLFSPQMGSGLHLQCRA